MGKKLYSWEKSYREDKKRAAKREKERLRAAKKRRTESERKASKEKNERLRALKRARKESQRKEESARKERERALSKSTKKAEEADKIAEIELEVELFVEFTERITNLHKKFKPNPKFMDHVRDGKSPNGRFYNKLVKPEAKIFVPSGPDEVTRMLGAESKYSFDQYCKSIAKVKNDLKAEIAQLELEASYTFEQFKDLNYSKFSIGRVLIARQKYNDFSAMKRFQLSETKSKLSKLISDYEEFKIKRENEYKGRLLLHKQNEEKRLKEVNEENEKIENEWVITQKSVENQKKIRAEWVDKIVDGEEIAIQQLLSFLFPLNFDFLEDEHDYLKSDPRDLGIAFSISDDHKMSLLIELEPDSAYYPDNGVKLSPSGKNLVKFAIKENEKKEKQKTTICSLALCYANFIFSYLEFVNELILEITEPRPNIATGNYEDVIVLQFVIDRTTISGLNLDKLDPVISIEHAGGKHIFSKKCSNLPTILDEDELQWLEDNSNMIEINNLEELIAMNSILLSK